MGSIPGLERSPGGGHGNPPQYSCLENPRNRGAWRATVRRIAESDLPEANEHATCTSVKKGGLLCWLNDPWVRKISWRRNDNPFQYSCLGNPTDSSLVGYNQQGHKSQYDLAFKEQQQQTNEKREWKKNFKK